MYYSDIPELGTQQYNNFILSAIDNKEVDFSWRELEELNVIGMSDCAYISIENNRFRFPVSFTLQKQIAEKIGANHLTAELCDQIYEASFIKLPATILAASPEMVKLSSAIKFNQLVEVKRAYQSGFIGLVGKVFLEDGSNYGLYDPAAPYTNSRGIKLWQNIGSRHKSEPNYVDYSQLLMLSKNK
jgi:hypothetical protein